MKKKQQLLTGLFAITLIFMTSLAEARVGGGRSSGSRGSSRGFAPRPSYGTSQNSGYGARPAQPTQPQNLNGGASQMPPQRSGFLSGLAGGVAGGVLGSMLFRGMGGGGMPMGGGSGGGFGLIELMLLAGLGYFAYRWFMKRNVLSQSPRTVTDFQQAPTFGSVGFTPAPDQSRNFQSIESPLIVMQAEEPGFDVERFKDERMEEFLKIQMCWGQRDLTPVKHLLELEIQKSFDGDLSALRSQGQINKIENVAIRGTDLLESWVEAGHLYATLHFRANLLDYTIDENTKAVVAGDSVRPVRFEEEWTFARPLSNPRGWKLTAIESV